MEQNTHINDCTEVFCLLLDLKAFQNVIRNNTVLHWPCLPRLLVFVCGCERCAERNQVNVNCLFTVPNKYSNKFCLSNSLSCSKLTAKKTCYQFTSVSKVAADQERIFILKLQPSCRRAVFVNHRN